MPKKGEIARKIKQLKAGKGVKAPKSWWDKIIKSLKGSPKYKKFSKPRLQRIAGGIWSQKPKPVKIKIIKEYQK